MKLQLNTIVVHNFKSYKGTHIINNIDPNFTAIVGPNGSGKSNIIDSILFVLGFRAKKMRHSQLTDLVYNDGTKETKCYVELRFNKFSIKREVNINKSTKYYINDKDSSSNEVIKIMMDEGVDMEHNRFLILQGEIESIAMLKPKEGLLEFLEDIIGTSKYEKEIEETTQSLKILEEENINRQSNLKFYRKELDHVNELKCQNEEIIDGKLSILELSKEKKEMTIELMKRDIEKKTVDKNEFYSQIENYQSKNLETRNLLNSFDESYKNLKNKLKAKEAAVLTLRREYKKLEKHNSVQSDLKSRLEKQIKSLKSEVDSLKCKIDMRNKENKIFAKEVDENQIEINKLNEDSERLNSILVGEENKVKIKAKKDISQLKSLEDELVNLLTKKSGILQENAKTFGEKKFKIVEKDLAQIEADLYKTNKELQSRKNRVHEFSQRQESDKKEKEMFKYFENIKGVYGRLKDVGNIEEKYETALKVACSRMNNIVVDTTTTAEKCIEIIKKHNLQRSTFIVIEKIKEIPELQKQKAPYLFELIQCEAEYKKCFFFALNDTLVCRDLVEAEQLAFGKDRKRVVTIDGKLIEKSGVMSGGKFNEKVKGYEELEKAVTKMNELRDQKIALLKDINEFENKEHYINKLNFKNKKIHELTKEIHQLELFEGNNDLAEIESKICETKDKVASLKKKVEGSFNAVTKTLRGELQVIYEKLEILENRNQELRIHLSEQLSDSFSEKENELKEKEIQLGKIQLFEIADIKNKLDFEEDEYNDILDEFKEVQEKVSAVKKRMGEDYHMEIDLKNKYDDVEEQINDLAESIEKCKEDERKISAELENLYKKLKGKKYKKSTFEPFDGKNLSNEDINDFIVKQDKKIKQLESVVGRTEIDFNVFEEYNKIKDVHDKVEDEFNIYKDKCITIKNKIDSLKNTRFNEFMEGFSLINKNLKEIYKTLTFGGNAELELVDYLDPFSEGIILAVMPPKKCWKNVSNLSGGEKTISSLSLIFALHKYKPSPFYVMDEIDAALDYRNVSIISNYLEEMTKTSQFIVISLRSDMFEISNSLLGIYKINNLKEKFYIPFMGLEKANNVVKFFFKHINKLIPVLGTKGDTILEIAHKNNIELEGACEGSCACSTCHVILDKDLYKKLGEPSDKEYDLLDQAYGLRSTSRLGCQIVCNDLFKDKIITIPKATRNMAVDGYIPKPH
ncbi:structural maintenance of chromosomes protein 4-like [Pieris brassicae]|uniref:structural maintenance of chromosomes protein 4-like n=1 Tax=Pieris brassicae TaxID=7116 RepID=UPI001E661E2A|nr:structural maintenance of chromosomes protein 4-like [Pieris brassicae]